MNLDMTWTDLGNPVPRDHPNTYVPHDWGAQDPDYLEKPHDVDWPDLGEVIRRRRTERHFCALDKTQLSAFLWWSCHITANGDRHLGFPLTQRPAPSAGAIHPIHVCVSATEDDWRRYDPSSHSLASIVAGETTLSGLYQAISAVVPPEAGTLLLFVAEPGKTYAKYHFADSLIWRDAGVLLGHMALVAEGLALNFCPLGITGEPWASRLDGKHKLVGVGAAILGSRSGV